MALKRSADRKVTNRVNKAGNSAAIRNAFGIVSGAGNSCPGATGYCEQICYAGKLEKMYPSARALVESNFEQLVNADYDTMTYLLRTMISEFVAESVRFNAPLKFRIHWDGDFFSPEYARAWAEVIEYFPQVTFWVYTRSYFALPILAGIPNLSLYISADSDNLRVARKMASTYNLPIAYVDETFDDGREEFGSAYKCPENGKRIPLISTKGSACVLCGICIDSRGDVLFARKGR